MNIINLFKTVLTKYMPRTDTILFESNPDYSDNSYWFFRYLAEHTDVFDRYTPIWVLKDKANARDELCGKKIKWILKNPGTPQEKREYNKARYLSKFIIDCNSYVGKTHKDQVRVFLGHGMPVKIAEEYLRQQGETDLNTLTSSFFFEMYKQYGLPAETLSNIGYCRNDILCKHSGIRKDRKETAIVWMPTYRQHSGVKNLKIENSFPLGLPVIKSHEQMAELNDFLKENNTVLYIRPHPAQDISVLHLDEMSNIVIANNDFLQKKNLQLYEFLTQTDALITDYSSVYYDYLLLDRPIALAVEDLEQFNQKWKLYFSDFKANYHCRYLDSPDDLKTFIREVVADSDPFAKERAGEKKRFFDYTDDKSCERLYNYMKEHYNF